MKTSQSKLPCRSNISDSANIQKSARDNENGEKIDDS
jgi:hypothetical protein